MRDALGIAQTDIILRTAILAGLDDIRANPKLLNYAFASLPKDALTYRVYGEEQVAMAKKWFLSQDIAVSMNTRVDESKIPAITIAQMSSSESAASLGDVHYQTSQPDLDTAPIIYAGPFTPLSYTGSTGVMVLNTVFTVELFPGMFVRDGDGDTYEILDVMDNTHILLPKNLSANFIDSYITSALEATQATLESREFRETLEIGCHVHSEPVYLTYLHSVVIFILLRYYEELLEARGFSRVTISSGDVKINTSFSISQPVFTRMVNVSGFVHQYWPKFIRGPIQGILTDVQPTEEPYLANKVVPAAYPDIKKE
jgi:hypothetical protein